MARWTVIPRIRVRCTQSLVFTAVELRQHEIGTEEVPTLNSAEIRFRHRCSGPVGSGAVRDFRSAASGEYFCIDDLSISNSSPICSPVTLDGAGPSVSAVERAQLKQNFLSLSLSLSLSVTTLFQYPVISMSD